MRIISHCPNVRSGRLLGLALTVAATVALTADTASAQRGRRGGGASYGGYGYGNNGYGNNGYGNFGYGNTWYGNNGYGYSGYNGYGNPWQGNAYGYNQTHYTPYYGSTTTSGYYNGMPQYYGTNPAVMPQQMAPAGWVVQASGTSAATGEMGLRVVEVDNGPAQTAGVQQGAVIVSVDGRRVHTFEELQTAIRGTQQGTLKITFLDPSGQRTTRDVQVRDNRIGVSVVPTPVSLSADEQSPQRPDNNATPNTTPGATTPGGTNPGTTTPGATIPGSTIPGSTTPGATTPRTRD